MRWQAVFALVMAIQAGATANVVTDLESVQGMEHFDGSASARDLLRENGFVVLPRPYHRIFSPYMDAELPPFVTADSIHRTYHVLFEDALEAHETAAHGKMLRIVSALLEELGQQAADGDAAALARGFLTVARVLLEGGAEATGIKEIDLELEHIRAHDGMADSTLFGYPMDYTQFVPRGFYTNSETLRRYFRAMTWMGTAAFRLNSARETEAALLLSRALDQCSEARASWARLDDCHTGLLGPCDDLTPAEYAALWRSLRDKLDADPSLDAFTAAAWELRDPRYNDMVLSLREMDDYAKATKGMRFMGRRYLPDGEVMKMVTYPEFTGRVFPSVLDVLAANGSGRAMERIGGESTEAHVQAVERARAVLDECKNTDRPSHYVQTLGVMEALTAPPIAEAAPFAKTAAYADKNLVTAAAVWTSMRHAWQLQAKMNMMTLGDRIGEEPVGYIEPNPLFFERMLRLLASTRELVGDADESLNARFQHLGIILLRLKGMLEKQLRGEAFNRYDRELFKDYGKTLSLVQGHPTNVQADGNLPWMGLAADVFTETTTRECLQVATGPAWPIYIVVDDGQGPAVFLGGVYSYFEFRCPVSERLTDEAWHVRLDRGALPALPAFAQSFMADGLPVDALIERLRNGEGMAEASLVDDPALDDFLVDVLRGDEKLASRQARFLIGWLATDKIPDKAREVLWERFWDAEPPPFVEEYEVNCRSPFEKGNEALRQRYEELRKKCGPAVSQAYELARCLRPEDITAAQEQIRDASADRVIWLTYAMTYTDHKCAEDYLIAVLAHRDEPAVWDNVLHRMRNKCSVDITPGIVERFKGYTGGAQGQLVATLSAIWCPKEIEGLPSGRYASHASDDEVKRWKEDLRALIPTLVTSGVGERWKSQQLSLMDPAAELLKLARAVDITEPARLLTLAFVSGHFDARELNPLVDQFPDEEWLDAWRSVWPIVGEQPPGLLCFAMEQLGAVGTEEDLELLRPFLKDTRYRDEEFVPRNCRVCDYAVGAMDRILGVESPMAWRWDFRIRRYPNQAVLDARRRELLLME